MKKKLFLLPLTLLLSLIMAGCNTDNDSNFDTNITIDTNSTTDTDTVDMTEGYLGQMDLNFYNFLDFNNFYENFKAYNEYRVFAPNNLETFEYEYYFWGVYDVRQKENIVYVSNWITFSLYVSCELFSLSGYLEDISELDFTNDKEFTYTISEGKTSYQYTLNVYYDENVIYVGTITCLDEEEDHFEAINENINLIVEEFYNGTFNKY